MQLSDFDPSDIEILPANAPDPGKNRPMTLDDLDPGDVEFVANNIKELKYGTLPQQALAGIEGAARGVSLGTSDYIAPKLGLSTVEDIQGRSDVNPWTSGLFNVGGSAALVAGSGALLGLGKLGIAGTLEKGALAAGLGKLGKTGAISARALGFLPEGAAFGAGGAISDMALGDPTMNGQKFLAHVGMGAAMGAGLGALSKSLGLAKALIKPKTEKLTLGALEGVAPIVDVPGSNAKSISQMQEAVAQAKLYGGDALLDMPEKKIVTEAAERLKGKMGNFEIQDAQLDSLSSQGARDAWKSTVQLPGKDGEIITNFQFMQKNIANQIIDNVIHNDIAPGYIPTTNAQKAGERVADAATRIVQGVRKELGPSFNQIKSTPLVKMNHLRGLFDALTKSRPDIGNMFEKVGNKISVKTPWNIDWGIEKQTYKALTAAFKSLEKNPTNFSSLINIRDGLNQFVKVDNKGKAGTQITIIRAVMMDYIQNAMNKYNPDVKVRDIFKRWAINEQAEETLGRYFNVEIGSGNFRTLAKRKPDEGIVGKIFNNSETVDIIKKILKPEDFNKTLADHMAIMKDLATTDGVFSSKKFTKSMRDNQYALGEAFGGNTSALQEIKDAATIVRIFQDAQPANPSGTTPTWMRGIKSLAKDPMNVVFPKKMIYEAFMLAKQKASEMIETHNLNEQLLGRGKTSRTLGAIGGWIDKVNTSIQSGAKSILDSNIGRGGSISGATLLTKPDFEKVKKRLSEISANPQVMIDHIADNTVDLYEAAPHITQSLSTSLFTGVNFLNSKLPQPPGPKFPLAPEWEPSIMQMSDFSKYYHAVNDPLGAFHQVKDGTISNQTMEALQVVYPALLEEMRIKTLEKVQMEKLKKLLYEQRLSLAKFLGTALDENMTSAAITSNQMAINAPNQSQQSSDAGKVTVGGLKELNGASRTATRTRRGNEDL